MSLDRREMIEMIGKDEARAALAAQLAPGEIVVAGPVPVERSLRFLGFVWVVAWVVPRYFYRRYWLGVTDRRVILLKAAWWSYRPKGVEFAESRAEVRVRLAQVGLRHGVIFTHPGGRERRLFFQRFQKFRSEISEVRQALSSVTVAAPVTVAPAAPEPVTAPTGLAVDDKLASLKQLAELRDQGILTDDEFAAEKAKLLGE